MCYTVSKLIVRRGAEEGALMQTRKEWKAAAKKSLRRHYWLFVAICLAAAILGAEYAPSFFAISSRAAETFSQHGVTLGLSPRSGDGLIDVVHSILSQNLSEGAVRSQQLLDEYTGSHQTGALARSKGVLANLINDITSGSILVRAAEAVNSVFHSTRAAAIVLTVCAFALLVLFWMCVQKAFRVVLYRLFLEGRTYAELPVHRLSFLHDVGRWWHASVCMAYLAVLQTLWALTIVGGVIKRYSYYLVPCIVAENPDIGAREAVRLSRRMMDGHKKECFCMELSLLGYYALGIVTFGLADVLFTNPYRSCIICEYYARLRADAKAAAMPGSEKLDDDCLFAPASADTLSRAYADVSAVPDAPEVTLRGVRKFFAEYLGVALFDDATERAWQAREEAGLRAERSAAAREGRAYPSRLSPLWRPKRQPHLEKVHYVRHYSLGSLIVMFFLFSFIGYSWEVLLHLLRSGTFVNRGTLRGPWLPIYGSGGVLILLVLNRLRTKPVAEFFSIIGLCGAVEYFTSFYLELRYGMTWWNYSGYFLNLNGRICAEGLLVFALGGMAVVYLIAPRVDNRIRRLPHRVTRDVCLVLLVLFVSDCIYSSGRPNTGAGISKPAAHDADTSTYSPERSLHDAHGAI